MFRTSFDRNVAETIEENFLSVFTRTQVLACVHSLHSCVRILDSCVRKLSSYVRVHVLQFTQTHDLTYVRMWHPCTRRRGPACTC